MRNSFKLTCLLRGLIPPLAFVAILTAPHTGASQTMVQRHDAVADFQKFLPSLPAIPWLNAQPVEGSKSQMRLPEAGSVSALLLMPRAATSLRWQQRQQA